MRRRLRCSRAGEAAEAGSSRRGARSTQPLRRERPRAARSLPPCGGRPRGATRQRGDVHRALQARPRHRANPGASHGRRAHRRWLPRAASRGARRCWRRSRPVRPRSPPARSRPVSRGCAAPSPPPEGSTTASFSPGARCAGRRARPVRSRHGRGRRGSAARGNDARGAGRQVDLAATGWREISWVLFLRAHYERAEESLARTAELAVGSERSSPGSSSSAAPVGTSRGPRRLPASFCARGCRTRAAAAPGQPLGQALTLLGRFHLLRGEIEDALHVLDRALERGRGTGHDGVLAVAGVVPRRT